MMVVGVDPGQTGALVLLESDGTFVTAAEMPGVGAEPSAADFAALLEAMGTPADLFVAIEMPFANNRASSIAQLNQGIGVGILLGVIGGLAGVLTAADFMKGKEFIELGRASARTQEEALRRVAALRTAGETAWSHLSAAVAASAAPLAATGVITATTGVDVS